MVEELASIEGEDTPKKTLAAEDGAEREGKVKPNPMLGQSSRGGLYKLRGRKRKKQRQGLRKDKSLDVVVKSVEADTEDQAEEKANLGVTTTAT